MEANQNNTILDVILEKSSNIEHHSNKEEIKASLIEMIKTHAKREKALRQSTVTFKSDEFFQAKEAAELIENQWTEAKDRAPATYWADKTSIYVQFVTQAEKNAFLDHVATAFPPEIRQRLGRPNSRGEHLERRPIRVEMNNVRINIKADRILATLNKVLEPTKAVGARVEDFHEGKPNMQRNRSILFKITAQAFWILFGVLDGALPFVNKDTNTKTRLFMKINCKPWTCRDCFAIGNHQCEGKVCAQCATKGHLTKDCKQKTKYCSNCKRRGHRAKDTHCPAYLNEVGKEIRKMDFPIEVFEEKDLRSNLIKHFQLK